MKNHDKYTEEIQDIITKPPHGLIRWGITWIFLITALTIGVSAFIYYPDVVKTNIRIHTVNSPKLIVSKTSGNLVRILTEENQRVHEGQVIGWMESTGDHEQIQKLKDFSYAIRSQFEENWFIQPEFSKSFIKPSQLNLGELKNAYQSFYAQFLIFESTLQQGVFQKRRQYLLQEIQNVTVLRKQLEKQKTLQQEDYQLAELEMKRFENLARNKVISSSEYEKQVSAFLAKQLHLQQMQSSLITNEGTMQARLKELADLDHQIQDEKSKFLQALNTLISQIDDWIQQYLLIATMDGILTYASILKENQFIQTQQKLFYINPGSSGYFGEIQVPQYNLGKVSEGQNVLIKLDSYPYEEFGMMRGKISQFNYIPVQDSLFIARIQLDSNSFDPRIQLRPGLSGVCEIITEEANLLSRLYRNIIRILR